MSDNNTAVLELPPDVSNDGTVESAEKRKGTNACRHCGKQYASRGSLWKHEQLCAAKSFILGDSPEQGKDVETKGADGTSKKAATPRERKPKQPTRKRHDASHILGTVWSQGARFVPSAPAQRAMVWQAPSAGRILDQAAAGTMLDRWVLQKIASQESKWAPVVSLVSLPLMLVLIDTNPALAPVLMPQLRNVVKDNLAAALATKAAEKEEMAELEALAEKAGMEWEQVDPATGEKMDLIGSVLAELLGQVRQEAEVVDVAA